MMAGKALPVESTVVVGVSVGVPISVSVFGAVPNSVTMPVTRTRSPTATLAGVAFVKNENTF